MKLFHISQTQNRDWDTFDSAVVAAPNADVARVMDPATGEHAWWSVKYSSWCNGPEHVTVRYLGEAAEDVKQGVICASFNAG